MLNTHRGIIETNRDKRKGEKSVSQKNKKTFKTKLYCRNLIKRKTPGQFSPVRYSGQFLKWIKEESRQMYQRTKKFMTMHKVLNPRNVIDRLYVSRKEGGRGLASFEVVVDTTIQWLEEYTIKRKGHGIWDDLDIVTKGKLKERNWIFDNNKTK